jgi:hypothetical protein
MSNELFNILSHSNKDIDNQKLMDYISGKLSDQEKHEVEKLMADNDLLNDAIEGLSNMKDKNKLQAYVDQLNRSLHNQLEEKKARREKKRLQEYPWIYFAIVLILLLCIIAFLIIRQFLPWPGHP